MSNVTINELGEISFTSYVKRGEMIVSRDALDIDDPEYLYNEIMNLGKIPEDYGVYHPEYEKYSSWSKELNSMHRAIAMGAIL